MSTETVEVREFPVCTHGGATRNVCAQCLDVLLLGHALEMVSLEEKYEDREKPLRSALATARALLERVLGFLPDYFPAADEARAFLTPPVTPEGATTEVCPTCNGAKKLPVLDFDEDTAPYASGESSCPTCAGAGHILQGKP